eukprot:TRINITY_DN32119_c0_g1_i1.p1 TRINITY_DN32119_c0_g1~~TRINITY_DN32119_c0_g1_i1.p1  ORF type:complete len:1183 (-),score=171.06 TRINITY_DN32119_c0_g1_i1:108-3656(-)
MRWQCGSLDFNFCLAGFRREAARAAENGADASLSAVKKAPERDPQSQKCGGCGEDTIEHSKGARGDMLCRHCIRRQDEALLEVCSDEERRGLDMMSSVLESVSWKYWKPGEQPAELLDWLFLGDLSEATDFALLAQKGITAVLNVINWWELSSRLPDVADMSSLYSSHGVNFLGVDSEDRLFFDIVGKCWPEAKEFLEQCRSDGHKVLVNCKAGHNRSACICVCWLVACEGMTLIEAVRHVQTRRGTILSNHGFRLQLVRLALQVDRLGEANCAVTAQNPPLVERHRPVGLPLDAIIAKKRMLVTYEFNSQDFSLRSGTTSAALYATPPRRNNSLSLISEEVDNSRSQRTLKMELLACLYHRGQRMSDEYEYTSSPPTVIGSGFSGDVVLCRRREKTAVKQNRETSVRCVKAFNLQTMGPDKLEKLKNEAVIYLSLEHPHIARLFDVYEDKSEVSLVMQYCSGGTVQDALRRRGSFSESEFQNTAVPMLLAVNYIHNMGIVHRDIKPRNWVYEADGETVKLIDFGFSVKGYLQEEGASLQGCMGTLGYLAPEVVLAGIRETSYTDKCDIWSLGVVFVELLTGQPAFHREQGQCDGYTQEVVLRDIQEASAASIDRLLEEVPVPGATVFLRRLLTRDPGVRPSAREVLDDAYLRVPLGCLRRPAVDKTLPIPVVLERLRAHCRSSKTSRRWLLAVARSPTYLPWEDFMVLRNTFMMFDVYGRTGTIDVNTFIAVITAGLHGTNSDTHDTDFKRLDSEEDHYWHQYQCSEGAGWSPRLETNEIETSLEKQVRQMWKTLCGEQESLSYCEFLAVLLPPIEEDVFRDDDAECDETPNGDALSPVCAINAMTMLRPAWNLTLPISTFLPLLSKRRRCDVPIFDESISVLEVVQTMAEGHYRWVIVRYRSGKHAFFDYMDVNRQLLHNSDQLRSRAGVGQASRALATVSSMPVGAVANCSGHSLYRAASVDTPLSDILRLISGQVEDGLLVRRVPIVNDGGDVVHVFSCTDFLSLALGFDRPAAVLRSIAARVFDRRSTMLEVSVQQDDAVLQSLRIMDSEHLTICPATLRELSGNMGGVVASNVVSVSDLKWVIGSGQFDILNQSVRDFISWRTNVAHSDLGCILREQRLSRFNVISVREGDSLHMLAEKLLASKLQRIFLSSDELGRIVGIVSSRDILVEVLDQIV